MWGWAEVENTYFQCISNVFWNIKFTLLNYDANECNIHHYRCRNFYSKPSYKNEVLRLIKCELKYEHTNNSKMLTLSILPVSLIIIKQRDNICQHGIVLNS